MGDIADYYRDEMFEEFHRENFIHHIHEKLFDVSDYNTLLELYLLGKLVWTTKTGEEILIQKLGFIHLDNCIKMLSSDTDNPMLRILKYEKEKRNNLLNYSETK